MRDGKIHIHIENSRSSVEVFIAKQKHVDDLLLRNPDLADKLCITIGSSAYDEIERWTEADFEEYYGYMKTADIMVGYSFPTKDIASYAPNLRWIHFISSGVEHITPFTWVPEGLTLINNRGVHRGKTRNGTGGQRVQFHLIHSGEQPGVGFGGLPASSIQFIALIEFLHVFQPV